MFDVTHNLIENLSRLNIIATLGVCLWVILSPPSVLLHYPIDSPNRDWNYVVSPRSDQWMASRRVILLFIVAIAGLSTVPSLLAADLSIDSDQVSSYIRYKLDESHHYRPSLVSFLHRQPDGSQIATTRYYRIVFHCQILPGSLYLRFSRNRPFRTVVQNRQDPSTLFAFRSVGAYSRVQIQNYVSGLWLCMSEQGTVVPKTNISVDNLACTFRQNSAGAYLTLVSELDPSRQMSFNTLRLLSLNPVLSRRYQESLTGSRPLFEREQCGRFMFDSQIERSLFNRTSDPFLRLRH